MTETPQIPQSIIDRLGLVPAEPDKQAYYGQYMPEGVQIYQKDRLLFAPMGFTRGPADTGRVYVLNLDTLKQRIISIQFLLFAHEGAIDHELSLA